MPLFLPVILGLLSSLFTGLVTFATTYLTKKFAFTFAAMTLFIGLTVSMLAALQALISGIHLAMPDEMNLAIGWFMPSNLPLCLAAYYSAVVARYIYDLKTKIVKSWR